MGFMLMLPTRHSGHMGYAAWARAFHGYIEQKYSKAHISIKSPGHDCEDAGRELLAPSSRLSAGFEGIVLKGKFGVSERKPNKGINKLC